MLAALPAGRVSAWLDLGASAATLLLACVLMTEPDGTLPDGSVSLSRVVVLRWDSLAALFAVLISTCGLAMRWRRLYRWHCVGGRRAAGQVMLGSVLAACLLADPLLTWLALVAATAAALYPALSRTWNGVPVAATGLALALFGSIAEHGVRATVILAPAALILGYATLASLLPDLLIVLLALLLRLRLLGQMAISPEAINPGVGPMLIGLGLAASMGCGLALLMRPDTPRRLALLRLGQGSAALVVFGLGGSEAVFAGLVQVVLLALTSAAAEVGGRTGPERIAVAAGLGGLPPLGVFPGLALIAIVIAHRAAWLLLPLGAGLLMMGWATVIRLSQARWIGPVRFAPVWVPLGLVLLIGWFLPQPAADWLRAVAASTP
jgi:hypothetical protein